MGCGASAADRVAPAPTSGRQSPEELKPASTAPPRVPGRRESTKPHRLSTERRAGVSAEPFARLEEQQQQAVQHTDRRTSVKRSSVRGSVRASVRASVTLANNSAVIAQFEKPHSTLEIIKRATESNPLFEPLDEQQRKVVYGAFTDEEYDAGDVVIAEGERGDVYYVVECGAFEAHIAARGEAAVKHYEEGTGFGELALLYNSPRAATVKCVKRGRLWAIDRSVFNMIMVASNKAVFTRVQEFLKSTSLLRNLSESQIDFLAKMFGESNYAVGEKLWEMGAPVETLYLVREGEIEIYADAVDGQEVCPGAPGDAKRGPLKRDSVLLTMAESQAAEVGSSFQRKSGVLKKSGVRKLITLRRGDWFGSAALERWSKAPTNTMSIRESGEFVGNLEDGPVYRCGGRALSRATVLELRRSTLRSATSEAVGTLPQQLLERVQTKAEGALQDFLTLTHLQRARLLAGLPAKKIADGGVLVQGEALVDEAAESPRGEESPRGGGRRSSYSFGDCVDETALVVSPRRHLKRIRAVGGDALVVELDSDLLLSLCSLMSTVARRSDNQQSAVPGDGLGGTQGEVQVLSLQDLQHVSILGAGGYGYVCLVQHERNNRVFALKKMSKPHIVAKRQVDHVNNERRLLAQCDHPFIIELLGSFQDKDYLYLLLELVLGGELFNYLDEQGPLSEESARFYAASVSVALEYLHEYHIVYRDLKPENLLLDSQGYIKVVDFGFAKVVYSGERTWTLCGTPEYLAPEIILRRGHDVRADWWSLGILIVELFCGGTPFYSDDHFEIFKKIVRAQVDWKQYYMPPSAKHFAQGLLVADPADRLGSVERGGPRELRDSAFFAPMDFVRLVRRDLPAPFVPRIDNSTDTRHCQDEETVELPEADAAAILAARKENKELHINFPEFDLMDIDEAWVPRRARASKEG